VKNLKTGTLVAIAAGGLFVSACKKEEKPTATPTEATVPQKDEATVPKKDEATADQPAVAAPAEKVSKVDCGGVNECKGQGTCKGETHGCGGQNACKGKGVLAMTEEECKAKGGTVAQK
jgi:hypothetical protein